MLRNRIRRAANVAIRGNLGCNAFHDDFRSVGVGDTIFFFAFELVALLQLLVAAIVRGKGKDDRASAFSGQFYDYGENRERDWYLTWLLLLHVCSYEANHTTKRYNGRECISLACVSRRDKENLIYIVIFFRYFVQKPVFFSNISMQYIYLDRNLINYQHCTFRINLSGWIYNSILKPTFSEVLRILVTRYGILFLD